MFSQSSIDAMSIKELVKLIRSIANEVDSRSDDPEDAYDYANSLVLLAQSLRDKIDY